MLLAQKLEIGDRLPDVVLNNVKNYNSSQLKLRDLNGKSINTGFLGNRMHVLHQSISKKLISYRNDLRIQYK